MIGVTVERTRPTVCESSEAEERLRAGFRTVGDGGGFDEVVWHAEAASAESCDEETEGVT